MESRLSMDDITLLDRLYNLRSDDSAFLEKIKKDFTIEEDKKKETEEKNASLEEEISGLEGKLASLKKQFSLFVEDFKGYDRANYAVLLDELKEEFDPQSIVKKMQEKAPNKINDIEAIINDKKNENKKLKENISEIDIRLEELENKKTEANNTRENLDKLLTEILAGNQDITPREIRTLLSLLDFSESDINACGKLLLFSDALQTYDSMVKERENDDNETKKNITEVLREAKASSAKEEKKVEEIKVETLEVKEEPKAKPAAPMSIMEEIAKELKESKEAKEVEVFETLGIDSSKLNEDDKEKIKNTNPEVLKSNMTKLNELEINIYDKADLLTDASLLEKVNMLDGCMD